jgi:hypothetical protein
MQLTCSNLFPHAILPFKEVNLDSLFSDAVKQDPTVVKFPHKMQELLRTWERSHECVSYGGWEENRSNMWNGTYITEHNLPIHLGVDVNLPVSTPVTLPLRVKVVDTLVDKDEAVGWGGRLIVEAGKNDPYLLLAHLNYRGLPKPGTVMNAGEVLSYIGTFPTNGNVFEHIHIQAIHRAYFQTFGFDGLDGYGTQTDLALFPNPLAINFTDYV